jgi:hypothetical protein
MEQRKSAQELVEESLTKIKDPFQRALLILVAAQVEETRRTNDNLRGLAGAVDEIFLDATQAESHRKGYAVGTPAFVDSFTHHLATKLSNKLDDVLSEVLPLQVASLTEQIATVVRKELAEGKVS